MALSEILALVSLAAALLLVAQALPWSRPGGGGAGDALLTDLLHGAGLMDLATRSNMILLCHAILIALLGNAGLLTNNNRSRTTTKNNAAVAAPTVEDHAWWPAPSREPEPMVHAVPTREIVHLVEKQGTLWRPGSACLIHGRCYLVAAAAAAGELHYQPAATAPVGKAVSPLMDFDDDGRALVADQEEDGAGDHMLLPPEEELLLPEQCDQEEEEEEDLDEMNRRFEAFIAATKEKMRLEALHPSHDAGSKAVLA